MKILWSPLARERAFEAALYISEDDPDAAVKWINRLFDAVGRLDHSPMRGRVVPELGRQEIREILFGEYRIVFKVTRETVEILTVRHGRRRFDRSEIDEHDPRNDK